jgi:hypothetical protein
MCCVMQKRDKILAVGIVLFVVICLIIGFKYPYGITI